jgi:hypothetical protein
MRKFLHRVVHRVGDGAGDVFGHGGFLRQITLGHRLQLVHQTQNGRLVGVIDALGFLLLTFGVKALAFRNPLALTAVLQLDIGQSAREQKGQQRGEQDGQGASAEARTRRQFGLQVFKYPAQWLAVGNDRGLRLARRNQALKVAQDSARLTPGVFIELEQRFKPFPCLGILGTGQTQLRAAIKQPLANFLERIQVFAQQEDGLGAHAFHRQEFVGRLADTLGQHHQLTRR